MCKMTTNMDPLNVAVKTYNKMPAENASDLRNKLVILCNDTRALNLSLWMLTKDQIILFFIKEQSKLVLNYQTNHISI